MGIGKLLREMNDFKICSRQYTFDELFTIFPRFLKKQNYILSIITTTNSFANTLFFETEINVTHQNIITPYKSQCSVLIDEHKKCFLEILQIHLCYNNMYKGKLMYLGTT